MGSEATPVGGILSGCRADAWACLPLSPIRRDDDGDDASTFRPPPSLSSTYVASSGVPVHAAVVSPSMRSSTGGITRSPSVGAVGLSSSPSFPPRSLNSGGVSSSASTSRLPPSHRPMSPEELDSDREQHPALPLQPRKVVGKLSGVGLPERATRKVTGGAAVAGSARAGPSTPSSAASTSAARRMTGTPLKASRKAKGPAGKEDGGKERVVVCVR